MPVVKNVRLSFLFRSIAWSVAFYLLLMLLLNWEDICGQKHAVVVTWEKSALQPPGQQVALPATKVRKAYIVQENG